MINAQPREPRSNNAEMIDVVSVFETIQGEGPYVGSPCIFVRVAGCNLKCNLCDTDYTTDRQWVRIAELCNRVDAIHDNRLVVLTGGEPFRQDIGPFVRELLSRGHLVQIETNGTYHRDNFPWDDTCIVCSPKTPTLHEYTMKHIDALKYVIAWDCVDKYDGLPTKVLGSPYTIARPWPDFAGDIYLQPEDHKDPDINKRNIEAAVASCFKYGYRLCLQTHKLLGLE